MTPIAEVVKAEAQPKLKPRWDVHFAPALLPFAHIQSEVVGTF